MRAGSNYLTFPVSGESIQGSFAYADRRAAPFSPDDDEAVAQAINDKVMMEHASVWFSQERDSKLARMNGEALEVNGQPVRFAHAGELAVFLCEANQSAA